MNKNTIETADTEAVEVVNKESEKPAYTFRKLNATDMFLMFKIIGKIGVNEFTACFEKDTVKQMIASVTGKNTNEGATTMVGISVILEVANTIISNLEYCEDEIFQMLSNTSDLTVKQVKELDFATFTGMVLEFVKKEEFMDFIKVVSKSFKLAN